MPHAVCRVPCIPFATPEGHTTKAAKDVRTWRVEAAQIARPPADTWYGMSGEEAAARAEHEQQYAKFIQDSRQRCLANGGFQEDDVDLNLPRAR